MLRADDEGRLHHGNHGGPHSGPGRRCRHWICRVVVPPDRDCSTLVTGS